MEQYYFTNFDPFNPPRPAPPKQKKEPPKPAAPPRMLILVGGGNEAMVALPKDYDSAVKLATEKFAIPPSHWVRLAVQRSDVPGWLGRYADGELVYLWVPIQRPFSPSCCPVRSCMRVATQR
jgi:hypothetical protein